MLWHKKLIATKSFLVDGDQDPKEIFIAEEQEASYIGDTMLSTFSGMKNEITNCNQIIPCCQKLGSYRI